MKQMTIGRLRRLVAETISTEPEKIDVIYIPTAGYATAKRAQGNVIKQTKTTITVGGFATNPLTFSKQTKRQVGVKRGSPAWYAGWMLTQNIVEAVRLPRGPNSRDDGDKDTIEEDLQETASTDVHGDLVAAGEYLEMAIERLDRALASDEGDIDSIVKGAVGKLRDYLARNEWVQTLKSNL